VHCLRLAHPLPLLTFPCPSCSLLPAPKQVIPEPTTTFHPAADAPLYPSTKKAAKAAPPYGQRTGWVPRTEEEFGDGGAFPEIHIPQFPLGLGQKRGASTGQVGGSSQALVPLSTDKGGNVRFDAIAQIGRSAGAIVHSRPADMLSKSFADEDLQRPDEDELAKNTERTRLALEAKVQGKVRDNLPTHVEGHKATEAQFFRYTPSTQSAAHNSGAQQRIIRMTEVPVDPLEPAKFKNVKAARGPPSPPATVMHSPPKKLTKEERDAWVVRKLSFCFPLLSFLTQFSTLDSTKCFELEEQ